MKVTAFLYQQGSMTLFTTVLPAGLLSNISEVPTFGDTPWGYQRPELPKHIDQIRDFVLGQQPAPLLPTAIVLGVNSSSVSYSAASKAKNSAFQTVIDLEIGDETVFRIIDGQHRLKGLRAAIVKRRELAEYPLPVNILVVDGDEDYRREIDTFITINSKAKRIKTDLAILARHQYDLNTRDKKGIVEYICTEIGYLMNAEEESIWLNAITVNLNEPGIISISAWNRSLQSAVAHELDRQYPGYDSYTPDVCHKLAKWFHKCLLDIWTYVEHRWPECFLPLPEDDDRDSDLAFRYDDQFVLQRAIGVSAMHFFLDRQLRDDPDRASARFLRSLEKSKIESDDWMVKGRFSGLTSMSGFNVVMREVFGLKE